MPGVCDYNDPAYDPVACEQQGGYSGDTQEQQGNVGQPQQVNTPPTTTPPTNDPFRALGDVTASQTFSVPGDIADLLDEISAAYRVPAQVLAAVLYQNTKWRKRDLSISLMSQTARDLRNA